MRELIIFEGAMCCSTGVCGPEPDRNLIEFNETLRRLQDEFPDWKIIRASMSFNLNMFLENKQVFELVKQNGPDILPLTALDGNIIGRRKYLKYEELKRLIGKKAAKVK